MSTFSPQKNVKISPKLYYHGQLKNFEQKLKLILQYPSPDVQNEFLIGL